MINDVFLCEHEPFVRLGQFFGEVRFPDFQSGFSHITGAGVPSHEVRITRYTSLCAGPNGSSLLRDMGLRTRVTFQELHPHSERTQAPIVLSGRPPPSLHHHTPLAPCLHRSQTPPPPAPTPGQVSSLAHIFRKPSSPQPQKRL